MTLLHGIISLNSNISVVMIHLMYALAFMITSNHVVYTYVQMELINWNRLSEGNLPKVQRRTADIVILSGITK